MPQNEKAGYNRFLLLVAGLGGLLYGVDVGIIASAYPYLEATSKLNASQLSNIVAAVLLGSVISTLFAGLLADFMGRKLLMALSGLLFVASIPVIALSHGYEPLILGRLLQGISAGLIGVVVPLYLAECLAASSRGKGTGIFQWLLTLGIVAAALVGMYFSIRVEEVAKLGDPGRLFAFKDAAWRSIFWVSLPPGILFVIGSFIVAESPRWLFRRGKRDAAYAALLRSRTTEQAEIELAEMEQAAASEKAQSSTGTKVKESLLRRKYVIPFVLACVILACNQATGVNSIIGYNTNILLQSGLSDVQAHWGYVLFTIINFLTTIGGVMLVDRKGRKFLLSVGTAGIILSLGLHRPTFRQTERLRVDSRSPVQSMVKPDQTVTLTYDQKLAEKLLSTSKYGAADREPPHLSGRHIFLWRFPCLDQSSALRRYRRDSDRNHSRELCPPQQSCGILFQSLRRSRCRSRGSAENRQCSDYSAPQRGQRMEGGLYTFRVHGVLCHRARSLCVAGTIGTDAHSHSLQRHEHCLADQPGSFYRNCRSIPADRGQVWLCGYVLGLRGLHRDLLHHGRLLPSRNQGQNIRGD